MGEQSCRTWLQSLPFVSSLSRRLPSCSLLRVYPGTAWMKAIRGIPVAGFKCTGCAKTTSVLPSFLVPSRHYTSASIGSCLNRAVNLGESGYRIWKSDLVLGRPARAHAGHQGYSFLICK